MSEHPASTPRAPREPAIYAPVHVHLIERHLAYPLIPIQHFSLLGELGDRILCSLQNLTARIDDVGGGSPQRIESIPSRLNGYFGIVGRTLVQPRSGHLRHVKHLTEPVAHHARRHSRRVQHGVVHVTRLVHELRLFLLCRVLHASNALYDLLQPIPDPRALDGSDLNRLPCREAQEERQAKAAHQIGHIANLCIYWRRNLRPRNHRTAPALGR